MSADYEFPACMHRLAAGLHMENINPGVVTIELPRDDWWRLWCGIESKYRNLMTFDGRGIPPDSFKYMGFTFRPRA